MTRPRNNRIDALQKQIKWIEDHSYKADANIEELKAELAELLEQEAKADALRRLPLYSCRITGFKFVCSKCYDKVYTYAIAKTKPETIHISSPTL